MQSTGTTTMAKDRIDQALEMAKSGDAKEAIRLLRPEMLKPDGRDQVIFALAFCFEQSENFATANYLYEELAQRHPSFELAKERQQVCRDEVDERGLIEDFHDIGHRECISCMLRYRSEFVLCPYCGTHKDSTEEYTESTDEQSEPSTEEHDPSILHTIEDMGRDAADRIQDFVESDVVKDISEKVISASIATGRKAKDLANSESAKEVKEKSAKIGKEVMAKAEKLSENSTIRDIAQKIEDVSWTASDKLKELFGSEKHKKVADKVDHAGKTILKKVRDVLDPPRKGD